MEDYTMSEDNCCYKACKEKVEIVYYGKSLCDKHWLKLVQKSPNEMKTELGINKKETR